MSVAVRTKTGPINRLMVFTVLAAAGTWLMWPNPASSWERYLFCGLCGLGAIAGTIGATQLFARDYSLRKKLAQSSKVSADHGTAREATWEEIADRKMDQPSSGNFHGLYAGRYPVFAPPKAPLSLVEMPPGVGKTVNLVTGSILHKVKQGYSVVVTDVKEELGPMLILGLRERGVEVWAVHPTGEFADIVGNTELNPYQSILDAAYAEDNFRLDAVKQAADYAAIHYPEKSEEKNPYFGYGSRRAIAFAILSNAIIDPGRCTPSDVFALLNDPRIFLKRLVFVRDHLEGADPDDSIVAHLKSEAANLLHRAKKNEENFASFLEGATQRLLPFTPGGRLGGYGRAAVHNINTLRDRQIVLFVMTPLGQLREFSGLISLLNDELLQACKRNPSGHKVHIVAEEALNYRFNNIVSDLETLRGLGVSMDFYIQSFAGLVRKYGKDAAAAIESYADVKIYAGLNSFDRARHVSDMLSEATIRKQDYSYQAQATELGISSRELGRRLMQPDEVLAMPRDKAWVFVRGMRPMQLTMAHYGQVSPWRDWVGDNPIEGRRLRDDPLFTIHYPELGTNG